MINMRIHAEQKLFRPFKINLDVRLPTEREAMTHLRMLILVIGWRTCDLVGMLCPDSYTELAVITCVCLFTSKLWFRYFFTGDTSLDPTMFIIFATIL